MNRHVFSEHILGSDLEKRTRPRIKLQRLRIAAQDSRTTNPILAPDPGSAKDLRVGLNDAVVTNDDPVFDDRVGAYPHTNAQFRLLGD